MCAARSSDVSSAAPARAGSVAFISYTLAHRAPLVAVVQHHPDARAQPRQRREHELRKRRRADQDHVVHPAEQPPAERELRGRLPQYLGIGHQRLAAQSHRPPERPPAQRRARLRARRSAARPPHALHRVTGLERPHALHLHIGGHVAKQRLILHRHRRVRGRQHGRAHPVVAEVLDQLERPAHARAARRREDVAHHQRPHHRSTTTTWRLPLGDAAMSSTISSRTGTPVR